METNVSEFFKSFLVKESLPQSSRYTPFSVTQEKRKFVSTQRLIMEGSWWLCSRLCQTGKPTECIHQQERMNRLWSVWQSNQGKRMNSWLFSSVDKSQKLYIEEGEMPGTKESILYNPICMQLETLQKWFIMIDSWAAIALGQGEDGLEMEEGNSFWVRCSASSTGWCSHRRCLYQTIQCAWKSSVF